MKITPIQNSFAAGEISPLMYGRSDAEGYKQGAFVMENMRPDSRGPSVARRGYEYADTIVGNNARMIGIPSTGLEQYAAIFVENLLVIESSGDLSQGSAFNVNPSFNEGSTGWTPTVTGGQENALVVFDNSRCELSMDRGNQGGLASITQEVPIGVTNIKFTIRMSESNVPVTVRLGSGPNLGDIYELELTTLYGSIDFPVGVWTSIWMSCEIAQDNTVDAFTAVELFSLADADATNAEFSTPYLEHELDTLYMVYDPSGNGMYVLHANHPPYSLWYNPTADTFNWSRVAFVNEPLEWGTGNYPRAGTFFEGRFWLGGPPQAPQTFWGSRSNFSHDFTLGDLDDDAIEFTMRAYGWITWMVGFKNLMIGTSTGEHIITSEGGFISPSDIQVNQQSSYGSAPVQALQVGDQVFYVSPDRLKVRAIQYEWQADNWLSKDLTFVSNHITKSGIKHTVWAQNPENLFICTLNNGDIATLTYDRGNNVYGWSKHTTQGNLIDVAVTDSEGTDQIHFVVKRDEGLISFESISTTNKFVYMDSWVIAETLHIDNGDGTFTILASGLDHLNGKECQVSIDSAVHPVRTPFDGTIEIEWDGQQVAVGLAYTKRTITLPIDKGSPLGSGAPYVKRYNKVYVRVEESPKPVINGFRAAERKAESPMDYTQVGYTEDILATLTNNDKWAFVEVLQDLPLPLTILSISGELDQSIL